MVGAGKAGEFEEKQRDFGKKMGGNQKKPRISKTCLLDVSLPHPLSLEVSEGNVCGLGWLKAVLL